MTQDEIILMARAAGFTDIEATALEYFYQAAFAAGAAHEREACAKVCEEYAEMSNNIVNSKFVTDAGRMLHEGMWGGSTNCAAAIRSRSNKH